jgi:hypothetical protein
MLKISFSKIIIIASALICIILFLFYVSVLGVNNNAPDDVKDFIQNISSSNYSAALQSYSEQAKKNHKSLNETMKFHFILELAMLEYFDLMDNPNYSIEIERENTWIPFLTSNELKVSVKFVPKEKTTLGLSFPNFFKKNKQKSLKKFITVVRENDKWKINKINIEGSEIESIFKRLQSIVIADKYLSITPKGFVLKEADIDPTKVSSLEKKILVHNLQTAIEIIEK